MERRAAPVRGADHAAVQCAIGVHFGKVMYGNVGAPKRLDFTVIGTAANVAARLSGHCKTLGRSLLVSAHVARHAPDRLISLGSHELRNLSGNLEIFAFVGPAPRIACVAAPGRRLPGLFAPVVTLGSGPAGRKIRAQARLATGFKKLAFGADSCQAPAVADRAAPRDIS